MHAQAQRAYTYLSSSIDDLRRKLLPLVLDDLAEGVLNCGVVGLDEVAVDVLYSKRGFACSRARSAFAVLYVLRLLSRGVLSKRCILRRGSHTDRPAANNSNLALLRWSRHDY